MCGVRFRRRLNIFLLVPVFFFVPHFLFWRIVPNLLGEAPCLLNSFQGQNAIESKQYAAYSVSPQHDYLILLNTATTRNAGIQKLVAFARAVGRVLKKAKKKCSKICGWWGARERAGALFCSLFATSLPLFF